MSIFDLLVLSTIFVAKSSAIQDQDAGETLHKTPPMGWSSWNTFFETISEDKVKGIADSIKRLNLDKFGYVYLTVDDFWNLPDRDPQTKAMRY